MSFVAPSLEQVMKTSLTMTLSCRFRLKARMLTSCAETTSNDGRNVRRRRNASQRTMVTLRKCLVQVTVPPWLLSLPILLVQRLPMTQPLPLMILTPLWTILLSNLPLLPIRTLQLARILSLVLYSSPWTCFHLLRARIPIGLANH